MTTTPFEAQCRGALSLVPVYFAIVSGQVRTQSDAPLQTILGHVLHQLRLAAGVDDAADDAAAALVAAVFDRDAVPLVAADAPPRTRELLDPQHKARLLAMGIAGAVAVADELAQREPPDQPATPDRVARAIQRFAASPRPQRIRAAIEHSPLFGRCLMPDQILDLILAAGLGPDPARAARSRHRVPCFDDYNADVFCSERARRNAHSMGLQGGFQFVVLN